MLTVIFGAGASFDSDPSHFPKKGNIGGDRPPLANELFADRELFNSVLRLFPACLPVVPPLRQLSGGASIEQVLERLQEESREGANPDFERSRQLAAIRFYIQTVIFRCTQQWREQMGGVTNYVTLLDEIRHSGNRDVALVTFNYDTLVESAIAQLISANPTTLDGYLELGLFALFKVHGSVNWGRVVTQHSTTHVNPSDIISAALIRDAPTIEVSDQYRLIAGAAPIVKDADSVLFPAVAVPVQTKQSFELPANHLVDLVRRLKAATHVLIVGWRGMDGHFAALLRDHLPASAAIQIVCGESSGEVRDTLVRLGVQGSYDIQAHTFSSYVVTRAGSDFLSAAGRNV